MNIPGVVVTGTRRFPDSINLSCARRHVGLPLRCRWRWFSRVASLSRENLPRSSLYQAPTTSTTGLQPSDKTWQRYPFHIRRRFLSSSSDLAKTPENVIVSKDGVEGRPIDFDVQSKIEGNESQIVTITLEPGQVLRAESGGTSHGYDAAPSWPDSFSQ